MRCIFHSTTLYIESRQLVRSHKLRKIFFHSYHVDSVGHDCFLSVTFSPHGYDCLPLSGKFHTKENRGRKKDSWVSGLTLGRALTTRRENKWFYWAQKKGERRHSTLHVQLKMSYEGTGSWCVEWWSSSLQSIQSCWKMKEWCLEPFPRIKTYT